MSDYIMLLRFTDKGVEKIKDSTNRLTATKKLFEAAGAKVKYFYAVLGRYDTIFIVDAPNDETIARLSLQLSAQGNMHTETLRAFSESQFTTLIGEIS